ncbi:hypothetical protein A3K72_00780 [Candidatus Woesearchaeota archaeon RBG_13_36_6]|nr:MAG: hypothetical protein A3K72_00780 [Candidatus Woesearchaeota archaeon RBG_13_36_6]
MIDLSKDNGNGFNAVIFGGNRDCDLACKLAKLDIPEEVTVLDYEGKERFLLYGLVDYKTSRVFKRVEGQGMDDLESEIGSLGYCPGLLLIERKGDQRRLEPSFTNVVLDTTRVVFMRDGRIYLREGSVEEPFMEFMQTGSGLVATLFKDEDCSKMYEDAIRR